MHIRKSAPAWLAAPVSVVLLLGVLLPALSPRDRLPLKRHRRPPAAAPWTRRPRRCSTAAPRITPTRGSGILDSFMADAPGDWAVTMKKLDTGQYAEVNSHTQAVTASLYKLFVLYEVMRQREQGKLSLDSTEPITDDDAAYDESIGELNWNIGDQAKVSTLIDRMITVSDNTAAVMLTNLVGADNINAEPAPPGPERSELDFSSDNLTTAADITRLLELIATGQVLDRDSAAATCQRDAQAAVERPAAAGPAGEGPMAHKTGTLFELRHDAGIVYGPSGPYVITVLSWN